MTDILTHVLTGFVLGTVLSFKFSWIDSPYITVVMIGAILPDTSKIEMIVPSRAVESALSIQFDWFVFHTPLGTVLLASIGSLLIAETHRRRAFALLLLGGASHFILDAFLMNPSRFSYVLLWPLDTVLVPLPMLILSSDRWPAFVALGTAGIVWLLKRKRYHDSAK
jgi:hypothetical protein